MKDIHIPGTYSLRQEGNTCVRDWYIPITPELARQIVALAGLEEAPKEAMDRRDLCLKQATSEIHNLRDQLAAERELSATFRDEATEWRDKYFALEKSIMDGTHPNCRKAKRVKLPQFYDGIHGAYCYAAGLVAALDAAGVEYEP